MKKIKVLLSRKAYPFKKEIRKLINEAGYGVQDGVTFVGFEVTGKGLYLRDIIALLSHYPDLEYKTTYTKAK